MKRNRYPYPVKDTRNDFKRARVKKRSAHAWSLYAIPKQTRFRPRNSKKQAPHTKKISLEFHEHKVN